MPREKKNSAERALIADAAKKTSTPTKPRIYLEINGKKIESKEIIAAVRASYRTQAGRVAIKSCEIYLKPEDSAAYYVVNGVDGKVDL